MNIGRAIDGKFCREAGTHSNDPEHVCPAVPEAEPWRGFGSALKPAWEPIVCARKPLAGTLAANVLAWGTGALNIDAARIEGRERTEYGLARATRTQGATYGTPTASADFDATKGRWPANVVLDEHAAQELDQQSGETTSASGTLNYVRAETTGWVERGGSFTPGREWSTEGHGDSGGASRFFKVAREDETWAGSDDTDTTGASSPPASQAGPSTSAQPAAIETSGSRFYYTAKASTDERITHNGTAHPTVKPLDLMRWLVRLVCPPGGVILEPFAGSGTTVEAALLEGFRCIAIEREADYLPLITQRIHRRRDPIAYITAAGEDLGLFELDGEPA